MRKIILLAFQSLSILGCYGQNWNDLDNYIQHLEAQSLYSGKITIYKGDSVIFTGKYGFKNFDTKEEIDGKTCFAIGSITKNLTRAAILQLIKEGSISLDDNVRKYIPELKNSGKITISQLLNHSSGLPNYSSFKNYQSLLKKKDYRFEDLIQELNRLPLNFVPGKSNEYSSTNYTILAQIIEIVTKENFLKSIEKIILAPYGFNCTNSSTQKENIDLAIGYENLDNEILLGSAKANNSKLLLGSGDFVMCQSDMLRLVKMIKNSKLLSKSQWLGNFEQDTYENHNYYWTAGFVNGYVTKVLWFPDADILLLFNSNINNGSHTYIINAALSTVFDTGVKPTFIEIKKVKVKKSTFVGTYTFDNGPNYFHIQLIEDKLFFRFKEQEKVFSLITTGENILFMPNDFAFFRFNATVTKEYESGFYISNGSKIKINKVK